MNYQDSRIDAQAVIVKKVKKYSIIGGVTLLALIIGLNSYTVVSDGTVKTQTFLVK